jgi:hypothetical protein
MNLQPCGSISSGALVQVIVGTVHWGKERIMFCNFLLVLIAIGAAFAFAASNTVPDSAAGDKANVVPGYTVTNLVYDLDATDPTIVDAITFDITPSSGSAAAVLVKIQTATGGSWTDCTLAA